MNFKKDKLLFISLLISVLIHILIFGMFFLFKPKPEEEKEKIITVNLEEEPKKKFQPPVKEKEESPQKIIKQTEKIPKPKPQPEIEKQSQQIPVETQKPQETEKIEQTKAEDKVETSKTEQNLDLTQLPQPEKKEVAPIDISKGRPEQYKIPEKKEEDIDGYLKELIRYLNQQARERDLYPPIAKRLKIEGQVVVRVTINEDGTIDENSIKIVESSGYNVLDKGSVEILKKLQPYKKPPKRITVEIPIVFQIIYM